MNRVRENVLNSRKNGMGMMLLLILLHLLAVAGLAVGIVYESLALIILCILILSFGWILFCGLKVLKPQEALVLTLFGKYVGTLKEPGFYYVNPFCTAVNPAAQTKLKQSGDFAVDYDLALVGERNARDHLEQRRFTRSVVAYYTYGFAAGYLKRNAVERLICLGVLRLDEQRFETRLVVFIKDICFADVFKGDDRF